VCEVKYPFSGFHTLPLRVYDGGYG